MWHPNHHGFKANHSTATAIAQIYDFWIKAAENKELTAALLLDLSAAFDVVDHQILLDKLKLYNFSPKALSWFKSYLEHRTQLVVVESKLSDPKEVGNQGVPQGSLLGPILFIIFYNDFPDVREEGSSVIYADDDTDNVSDKNLQNLQAKIQREANLSTAWVKDNKLVCSGSKTKLLIVGTKELRNSKNRDMLIEINVDGHEVRESKSERLLGVIVNNVMTWEHHLYGDDDHKGLIDKLSARAKMIWKLSKMMPKERLKVITEGIFFSILNYCIEIYGNVWGLATYDDENRNSIAFTKDDNMKLQIIVNKVLRATTGLERDAPITELLKQSGQLSVHQRTALYTLTSVHKATQQKKPVYSYFRLQANPTQVNVRTIARSRVDCKLSISRGRFYYRGCKLYNSIPESLIQSIDQTAFKKGAKQWVLLNIPALPP